MKCAHILLPEYFRLLHEVCIIPYNK